MTTAETIFRLERNFAEILRNSPRELRLWFRDHAQIKSRATLIIGPRGVGKTTYLVNQAKIEELFYFSADNPNVSSTGIWQIGEEAIAKGYKGLAIDEVHFANNWSQDLKALYDSYPSIKIYASDSSSLIVRKGLADLSRRFPRFYVPLLSFREFVFLKTGNTLPVCKIFAFKSIVENGLKEYNLNELFKEYLAAGLRPIFLEGSYNARLLNIIEKTIFTDVPFLLPQVKDTYLRLLNAIMGYLASASIPTLNIDSLTREWSIGKEKLYELLAILEHVDLLNIIRFPNDKKASGKGAKIFFADPSMYSVLGGNVGTQREAFVVAMTKQIGLKIYACKDEEKGDFIIDDKLVEVGGRNKKLKAAEYVIRDDIAEPIRNIIPLWMLGLLY